MEQTHLPNRREFMATAAALAAVSTVGGASVEAAEPAAPAKIRVGCLSWVFHSLSPGADPEPAIDTIGELGFDGIELIICARPDIQGFWTDAKIDQLRKKLDARKLFVSQFVLFQPVVEGLSSLHEELRQQSLDALEAGCRIGRKFNAPIINIVAPWSRDFKGPSSYLPRFYEIPQPREGQKFHLDISDDFDFEKTWDTYVQTTKACLERAKAHGLKFSIEHHTHCLVQDADAFLRLAAAIPDKDLGYNLDVGWTLAQREYPPMAIHKTKNRLMNVHMRDIDGMMRKFVPIGDGVMDFKAIISTLKRIGYTGFVSLEQDRYPKEMKAICRDYLRIMRESIG